MARGQPTSSTGREGAAERLVAFAALLHARVTNDQCEADRRTRELESLGVQIAFAKPAVEGPVQAREAQRG